MINHHLDCYCNRFMFLFVFSNLRIIAGCIIIRFVSCMRTSDKTLCYTLISLCLQSWCFYKINTYKKIRMSGVGFDRVVLLPAKISLSLRTQTHPPAVVSENESAVPETHFSRLRPIYLTLKFFRNFSR